MQALDVANAFELGKGHGHVVLVHGFTGSPYEVRSLGADLAARGQRAHGVHLTGHGLDPYALLPATADDWRRDVLGTLDRINEPVALVGLSMGAMLAAMAAAERPTQVRKLVLLAPALRLSGLAKLFIGLSRFAGLPLVPTFATKRGSDIFDSQARDRHPGLKQVPLAVGAQFARVAAWGGAALAGVRCPTLVMGAINDHTVPFSATLEVFARLGTNDKRFVRLERSFHIMTLDVERDVVANETYDWVR